MSFSQIHRVTTPALIDLDRPAWIVAISTWVIGDLVTTAIGLSLGATEANEIAAGTLSVLGPWGLIPLQLVALGLFGSVWFALRARDVDERVGIPIGLSITGTLIVLNNLAVISVLLIA